jgi:hypothetical protein
MELALTESQEMLRTTARSFMERHRRRLGTTRALPTRGVAVHSRPEVGHGDRISRKIPLTGRSD